MGRDALFAAPGLGLAPGLWGHASYANILLNEDSEFEVWGVVTRSIRILI